MSEILREVRVSERGDWAIDDIPADPGQVFRFRLHGQEVIPQEEVASSVDGTDVVVSFSPIEFGGTVEAIVLDEHETSVPNANVAVSWRHDDEWRSQLVQTDEEGRAVAGGIPEGNIWVRAYRSGFVGELRGPVNYPINVTAPFTFRLVRAGRISGRVSHGGEPVEDFRVMYWGDDLDDAVDKHFPTAPEGRFELDEVQIGNVSIVAWSSDLPRSRVISIDVGSEEAVSVELELPRPVSGRGRIVDALTGDPVSHAVVQPVTTLQGRSARPWGAEQPVRLDGSFKIEAFPPGRAAVSVTASGFERVQSHEVAGPSGVDFGIIPLARLQALEIRLVGGEAKAYPGFSFDGRGRNTLERRGFDESGVLRYEGVNPGTQFLQLHYPDGWRLDMSADLPPGRDWTVEFPISATRTVVVNVSGELDGDELGTVGASFKTEAGHRADRFLKVFGFGEATFHCIQSDSALVTLYSKLGAFLGAYPVALPPTGDVVVPINLVPEELVFQVQQPDGEAITQARVIVSERSLQTSWHILRKTGADGLFSLGRSSVRDLSMDVTLPDGSFVKGLAVTVPADHPTPIPVVVEIGRWLGVALFDGGEPVPGVALHLQSNAEFADYDPEYTDPDGRAAWGPLGGTAHRVVVSHPGLWATDALVPTALELEYTPIQVRRVGSLQVSVSRAGAPVAGQVVSLEFVDSGESVSTWLEDGRLVVPGGTLVTGEDGSLRVDGVPNGDYRWNVQQADGPPAGGTVAVRPFELARVVVSLP